MSTALLPAFGQLKILPEETRLLRNADGSFELYVLKTEGRESILLVDSSADPNGITDNYALRAYDWDASYGDEKRLLNGKLLEAEEPLYFLMSSNAQSVEGFPEGTRWFHIHMPAAVLYGYPWGREGQFEIKPGTWLNVRAFSAPHADYQQPYGDNPFVISRKIKEEPRAEREEPFFVLAAQTQGRFYNVKNSAEMLESIGALLLENQAQPLDIAFVIDTTISMKDDIEAIKKELAALLAENYGETGAARIGFTLYRDYGEQYLTQPHSFSSDIKTAQNILQGITVAGGRDIPEAVYEGLETALDQLSWQSAARIIVQIGDAPPHAKPRGEASQATALAKAAAKNVKIYCILLPDRQAPAKK